MLKAIEWRPVFGALLVISGPLVFGLVIVGRGCPPDVMGYRVSCNRS